MSQVKTLTGDKSTIDLMKISYDPDIIPNEEEKDNIPTYTQYADDILNDTLRYKGHSGLKNGEMRLKCLSNTKYTKYLKVSENPHQHHVLRGWGESGCQQLPR